MRANAHPHTHNLRESQIVSIACIQNTLLITTVLSKTMATVETLEDKERGMLSVIAGTAVMWQIPQSIAPDDGRKQKEAEAKLKSFYYKSM